MSLSNFSDTQINRLHQILDAVSSRVVSIYMHEDIGLREKIDGSPLTEADLLSSQFLGRSLPSVLDVPIVCEETFSHITDCRDFETYWLVDPIDGTKGFVKRNGQFCVCVALIHQNHAILGAIFEPLTQTCWIAEKDKLRKWVNNHPVSVSPAQFESPFVIITGNGQVGDEMQNYINKLDIEQYDVAQKGSALKFTDIADGFIDLYVKIGKTSEWDTAAGQVIVESLGGCVLDANGVSLKYGMRDTIINPFFVACAPTMTKAQIEAAWQSLPKCED